MPTRRFEYGCQDGSGRNFSTSLLWSNGPTGHYWVDTFGNPILVVGDSAWCGFTSLRFDEWLVYLNNRARKGVNLVNVELVEHFFSVSAPNNAYGEPPFLTPGDITTPNPAYFARAVAYMQAALEHGIVVMLFPLYFGFGGGSEGWYADALTAGATAVQAFCAYVANLFKGFPNLIWAIGGDYKPASMTIADACAAGIVSQDTAHMITANGSRNLPSGSSARDWPVAWVTTNTTYTGDVVYVKALADYQQVPAMPSELVEAIYELTTTGQVCRQQLWPAVLYGLAGSTYGADGVWQFSAGWDAKLDLPGARSLEWFARYFRSIPWWQLVPDDTSALVQAGSRGTNGNINYITAARTPDGKYAAVYFSNGGSATLNIAGVMSTPCAAEWLNPLTGAVTPLGSFSGATQAFTAPASHADGTDYVLCLRGA